MAKLCSFWDLSFWCDLCRTSPDSPRCCLSGWRKPCGDGRWSRSLPVILSRCHLTSESGPMAGGGDVRCCFLNLRKETPCDPSWSYGSPMTKAVGAPPSGMGAEWQSQRNDWTAAPPPTATWPMVLDSLAENGLAKAAPMASFKGAGKGDMSVGWSWHSCSSKSLTCKPGLSVLCGQACPTVKSTLKSLTPKLLTLLEAWAKKKSKKLGSEKSKAWRKSSIFLRTGWKILAVSQGLSRPWIAATFWPEQTNWHGEVCMETGAKVVLSKRGCTKTKSGDFLGPRAGLMNFLRNDPNIIWRIAGFPWFFHGFSVFL